MKKCLQCNSEVDLRANVCPRCGGTTLMASGSAEDILSMLDSRKDQYKAKEHVDRSVQLCMAGRVDEAIAEGKKALKLNPMNPTAHGNMGGFLLDKGQAKEAIPWLEKALELNPLLDGVPQALARAKAAAKEKDSSGCFVATACYGDPYCSEVNALRTYRDTSLSRSIWGRALVRLYYSCSPAISTWLVGRPNLCSLLRRRMLSPIVNWVQRSITR